MKNLILAWAISFIALIILDFIWLSITIKLLYKPLLGHLFKQDLKYYIAIIFYFIYAFGIAYLIILTNLKNYNYLDIILRGFILGIITYGAYDLTNQATLKNWPIIITIIDMLWGGILTSLVSFIAYYFIKKITY